MDSPLPFGPAPPGSPPATIHTRSPRINAPAVDKLTCFLLNQLQLDLTPPDLTDRLFTAPARDLESVHQRYLPANSQIVVSAGLTNIPGMILAGVQATVEKKPDPERNNDLVYLVETLACCLDKNFDQIQIARVNSDIKPMYCASNLLQDGSWAITRVAIGIEIRLRENEDSRIMDQVT